MPARKLNKQKKQRPKEWRRSSFLPTSFISNERLQQNALVVQKTTDKGIVQSSTTANTYGSFQFLLSDLNEVASYTAIFDQYKFVSVKLLFTPVNGVNTAGSGTLTNFNPVLYTCIDYDDNGTPSSIATVLNYANVRVHKCGAEFAISFKPHVAMALYTGTFGGYGNIVAPWIDAASTNVQHYGVKYALPSASFVSSWQVTATYTLAFRNIR